MKTFKNLFKAYANKVRNVPNIEKQAKYNLILAIAIFTLLCTAHLFISNTIFRCIYIAVLGICGTDCTASYFIQKEHIKNENKKKTK